MALRIANASHAATEAMSPNYASVSVYMATCINISTAMYNTIQMKL